MAAGYENADITLLDKPDDWDGLFKRTIGNHERLTMSKFE